MTEARVLLARSDAGGDWGRPPFDPADTFPELAGGACGDNELFGPVRDILAGLGLDASRHGRPDWNPLRELVPAGGRIILKPNMVRHVHGSGGGLESVVTDPRLVRAVLEYAAAAVGPGGSVIIADSPLQSCDFDVLGSALGLPAMLPAVSGHGASVSVVDYRREAVIKGADGLIGRRTPLAGDPEGYVAVDLGTESALRPLWGTEPRFRVTQYDRETTTRHHQGGHHEFLIPRSLLRADLVISLPKLKTHRKAGITGALKNLVGINGSKAWLPHHRAGSVSEGGDEYLHPSWRKRCLTRLWERMDRTPSLGTRRLLARVERAMRRSGALVPFPDPYFEGSWWGNLTMAAMVCDLNRIFMYADADGRLAPRPARRFLVLADGVTAGEGEGPLEPTPRRLGVILGGTHPLAVDWVAATLMGFDPERLPILTRPLEPGARPLVPFRPGAIHALQCSGPGAGKRLSLAELAAGVERPFVPAAGWRQHLEPRAKPPGGAVAGCSEAPA